MPIRPTPVEGEEEEEEEAQMMVAAQMLKECVFLHDEGASRTPVETELAS